MAHDYLGETTTFAPERLIISRMVAPYRDTMDYIVYYVCMRIYVFYLVPACQRYFLRHHLEWPW